jgi:Zn-dependent protease with chaperone function
MFSQFSRLFLAGCVACALFASIPTIVFAHPKHPLPTAAQQSEEKEKKSGLGSLNPFSKNKEKEKAEAKGSSAKKEKEEAKNSPASAEPQPKVTKQEREYQKIKQFSDDLYAKDPVFREEVEAAYRQKQREHSEYAFFINTRDAQDEQITRTGDKLKIDDTLYDNPLVQDYVNRVGQSVVPPGSTKFYAFKVTLNPIPEARSLSTGTVYISSGLLSWIDNEAQLAYILGHEIAHVEKEHWHQDALVERGLERYNEKQEKKRAVLGGLANIGLSVFSGGMLNAGNLTGAAISLMAQMNVPTLTKLFVPNAVISWDKAQEDEADQLGLRYMFDRRYDPREVPKFYAALQRTSQRDARSGLGFMADPVRILERVEQVNNSIGGFGNFSPTGLYVGAVSFSLQQKLDQDIKQQMEQMQAAALPKTADAGKPVNLERDAIARALSATQQIRSGPMAAELKAKLDAGELIGSTAEFAAVMAELKRDNGVRAYYYDMFEMSRRNLEESLLIRSNDPLTHFYYGKTLKLTGRSAPDRARALNEFVIAIALDVRRVLAEPHLYRALAMIDAKDANLTLEIVGGLKQYVDIYQRENGGQLPPNMNVIYDYLQEVGELTWAARPLLNVKSTPEMSVPLTVPVGLTSGPRKQ